VTRHEVGGQRLANRHLHRIDEAQPQGHDHHHPDLDDARAGQDEEDQRLARGGDRRGHEGAALVDAVGEDATERREEHRRSELQDGHEAELQRRAAEGEDQPGQADLLHPRADVRDHLAGPEEAVVAHAERREAAPQPAEGCAKGQRTRLIGARAGLRFAHG
jgi:hypothetical protein